MQVVQGGDALGLDVNSVDRQPRGEPDRPDRPDRSQPTRDAWAVA
jgi:hypothetical protein